MMLSAMAPNPDSQSLEVRCSMESDSLSRRACTVLRLPVRKQKSNLDSHIKREIRGSGKHHLSNEFPPERSYSFGS